MNINETCELNGHYPSDEARLLLLMPRLKRNQKSNMELIRENEALRGDNENLCKTINRLTMKISYLQDQLKSTSQPVVIQMAPKPKPRITPANGPIRFVGEVDEKPKQVQLPRWMRQGNF